MSAYLDAEQFHAVMLSDTTPRCMTCLPRAVSVSLRIGEHQASDRWRRNLCKANVFDARRNRTLKERLETIYKLTVQMEKEEKELSKMLNNSQWSRELAVHQPNFEASWEIVRRLDTTSESARPDTQ